MAAHLIRDDFEVGKFGELIMVSLTSGGDEVLATRANVHLLIHRLMAQLQKDDARPMNVIALASSGEAESMRSPGRGS